MKSAPPSHPSSKSVIMYHRPEYPDGLPRIPSSHLLLLLPTSSSHATAKKAPQDKKTGESRAGAAQRRRIRKEESVKHEHRIMGFMNT